MTNRGDHIEVFKIVNGNEDIDRNNICYVLQIKKAVEPEADDCEDTMQHKLRNSVRWT